MSVAASAAEAARFGGRTVDLLLERPRAVLGTLIVGQIAATLVLALSVDHNGWVWFQGGDQIWMTTTGWLFGHGDLPPTEIAYLWPTAQVPITWVTGPTYVQALPPLIVAQVLVLGPIALICLYGIAARIGGRLLGYWAAVLWVLAPFASIPLFVDRYQERWAEHFLPQALGLTAMADFPSMVITLAAALFVVRSLSPGHITDAALAGSLLGAAAALKPPNLLVAAGIALAYVVARRWREGVVCGAAAVPALLVLLWWKVKGLGEIPAFALEQTRLAADPSPLADFQLHRYFDLDWEHWRTQMDQLREFFWSPRLAQWAPFAGLAAVLRVRRWPIAALLAGWLAAYLLVKGFSTRADIQANTFWRLLMPAWPAYLLLFASIPLLVPTLARRLGDRVAPATSAPARRRWLLVAAALTVVVPAAGLAVAAPLELPPTETLVQDFPSGNILTPIDDSLEVKTERVGSGVRVTWNDIGPWRSDVFYRVYRHDGPGEDTECVAGGGGVALYCFIRGTPIATTRDLSYLDESASERATYRVGIGTNWIDDPEAGDVFVFSPSAAARG